MVQSVRILAISVLALAIGTFSAPVALADHYVLHDVQETLDDPTHPQYDSIKNPCWKDEWGCGGCGPDLLEWIIGPIYCP